MNERLDRNAVEQERFPERVIEPLVEDHEIEIGGGRPLATDDRASREDHVGVRESIAVYSARDLENA